MELNSTDSLASLFPSDASGLLRAVTQFSHLAADTIVNGAATAHSVPTDQADRENTDAYTSMKHKNPKT